MRGSEAQAVSLKEVRMAARKRHDPPSRPAEHVGYDQVGNLDPNRHYVFADPNDPYCGMQAYEAKGYIVEKATSEGPVALRGRTKDGQVTSLGSVLMSCPIEQKQEEDERAANYAKAIDSRILKEAGLDGFRGGRGFTTRASVESDR
jgi:hypothetical protein